MLTIKWLDKTTFGMVDLKTGEIWINEDLFLADTLIHERTHFKHPKWSERQVIRQTLKEIDRMTVQEIRNLARWVRRKAVRK